MKIKRVTVDIFTKEKVEPQNIGTIINPEGEKNSDKLSSILKTSIGSNDNSEDLSDITDEIYNFEEIKSKIVERESRRLELIDDNIEDINESIKKLGDLFNTKFEVLFINYSVTADEVKHEIECKGGEEGMYIEVDFRGKDIRYYPYRDGISYLVKVDKREQLAKQEHMEEIEEFIEYTQENPEWATTPDKYRLVSERCYTYSDKIKNKEELNIRAGKLNGERVILCEIDDESRVVYSLEENRFSGVSYDKPDSLEEGLEELSKAMGIEMPEYDCYPYYSKVKIE